jgi:hypothetical protein
VIFNAGSIAFPISKPTILPIHNPDPLLTPLKVGFYARIWWLDALGGLLLSLVVIFNWSATSSEHIKNLCGFSATADQRNVLLYLTMRFAKTINQIQGLQAYHAGDKLNVEVDIVLDASTSLKDSHDLAYVLLPWCAIGVTRLTGGTGRVCNTCLSPFLSWTGLLFMWIMRAITCLLICSSRPGELDSSG